MKDVMAEEIEEVPETLAKTVYLEDMPEGDQEGDRRRDGR